MARRPRARAVLRGPPHILTSCQFGSVQSPVAVAPGRSPPLKDGACARRGLHPCDPGCRVPPRRAGSHDLRPPPARRRRWRTPKASSTSEDVHPIPPRTTQRSPPERSSPHRVRSAPPQPAGPATPRSFDGVQSPRPQVRMSKPLPRARCGRSLDRRPKAAPHFPAPSSNVSPPERRTISPDTSSSTATGEPAGATRTRRCPATTD